MGSCSQSHGCYGRITREYPTSKQPTKAKPGLRKLIKDEEAAVASTQRTFHAQELQIGAGRRKRAAKRNQRKREPKEKKKTEAVLPQSEEKSASFRALKMPAFSSASAFLRANGGGSPSGSSAEIITATQAAKDALRVMMDPFTDAALARWPDPFTLEPTMTAKDVAHHSLTIWNGIEGAYDGACAMYIRGDAVKSYAQPSSISNASTSARYDITWQQPNTDMKDAIPASSNDRPVAIGHRFTYSGVGNYHAIVVRVVEIPPWPAITSGFDTLYAFPLKSNEGPNFYQREFYRAREVTLNPGESLTCISYPLDALGLVFGSVAYQRGDIETEPNTASWNGYIIWANGLTASDTLYHDAVIHHEFVMPPSAFPRPIDSVTGIYPKAVVKPDGGVLDGALGKIIDVIATGANVFKSVLTKGEEIFRSFVPMLGSSQTRQSWVRPMSSTAQAPTPMTMVGMGLKPTPGMLKRYPLLAGVKPGFLLREGPRSVSKPAEVAEQKTELEDQPIVLTPQSARRPSLSLSLRSGRGRQ